MTPNIFSNESTVLLAVWAVSAATLPVEIKIKLKLRMCLIIKVPVINDKYIVSKLTVSGLTYHLIANTCQVTIVFQAVKDQNYS
ncbi:hypothetical protein GCM10007978_32340 [Shewanella hanedai]|nr:hypothetical protein GCM10007978_32340 [Shewanella hanedai]